MLKTKNITATELPSFVLSESDLGMGASLGNGALWVQTKGTGAIESVFLNDIGRSLIGSVSVRFGAHARALNSAPPSTDGKLSDASYIGVYPEERTCTFEVHPAYQRLSFQVAAVIDIEETLFVPLGSSTAEDSPVVHLIVDVHNRDDVAHLLRLTASAMLRGATTADVRAYFDETHNALVAVNATHPDWVRVFTVSEPARYCVDLDFGSMYDPITVQALKNTIDAEGDVLGHLQLDFTLAPDERRRICFTVALSSAGVQDALRRLDHAADADATLAQSIELLESELSLSQVITPDKTINQGALWSKVNMRRVMAAYNTGNAFTNDPGRYANVVVRDCAWFIFGNDHFLPGFSRELLDGIALRQYTSGKLPEYFDAVDGRVEDYDLNINDDTPLYILAVNHHFRATGDMAWLGSAYESVSRAAHYIISQIDNRGLVFCTADDPAGGVRAIAGWRNIIEGYSISGAVTELNAQCVAALRSASHLADNLGRFAEDARTFLEASERLKSAMDRYLINPHNGLYYLNIDVEGHPHTDVTGDEIFPVIMRACDDETAFRIISRLNYPDFWTAAGLRTISRYDPRYNPCVSQGLLGGVWPGLTWWYAFGAARYHPEMMVRALRSSFEHYGADPKRNNTVPGQFSEWFDGESLENRGMRLSPWEPPRFLWAAIEGVCGLVLGPGLPRVSPLIPSTWNWVGLRALPYHGALISYFVVREGVSGYHVYSTSQVQSEWEVFVYEEDISDSIRVYDECVVSMALARDDGAVMLLGNTSSQTVHTPVMLNDPKRSSQRFAVRIYNSERSDWEDTGTRTLEELRGNAIWIEAGGFRLIEITALQQGDRVG